MRVSLLVSLTLGFVTTAVAHVASAAPCSVSGQTASIANVSIQPASEDAFSLALEHLPVEARLSGTNAAELHVKGPLRFTTEHPWNALGVNVRKRISLLDGRLVLSRALRVSLVANKHDKERSDIPVALPLSELQPSATLLIPCQALTLPRNVPLSSSEPPEHLLSTTKIAYATTSNEFALYARPKAVAPWRIKFRGALKIVKRSGGWVKVQAKWTDGSMLQGWASSEHFSIERSIAPSIGHQYGIRGIGTCGSTHRREPVPFLLKANAPIHSGPQGAIWAHTSGVIKVHTFSAFRSDGWLQIARIDGFPKPGCGEHSKIWVHADFVKWTDTPME